MYHDSARASYVELPIIEGEQPPAQPSPTATAGTPAPTSNATAPAAPTATTQAPAATGTVAAPPASGSGPANGGSGWGNVAWLLVGVGAATAVAGGISIRVAKRSRRGSP
jgi:hypothetical protein